MRFEERFRKCTKRENISVSIAGGVNHRVTIDIATNPCRTGVKKQFNAAALTTKQDSVRPSLACAYENL